MRAVRNFLMSPRRRVQLRFSIKIVVRTTTGVEMVNCVGYQMDHQLLSINAFAVQIFVTAILNIVVSQRHAFQETVVIHSA